MTNQFPRNLRLVNADEFRTVFKLGKKCNSQHLAIYSKPNQHKFPRLGLVIARKAVRLAVQRNLIKRSLREGFRVRQAELNGYDIVVVVYRGIHLLNKKELRSCLEQQWQKVIDNNKRYKTTSLSII